MVCLICVRGITDSWADFQIAWCGPCIGGMTRQQQSHPKTPYLTVELVSAGWRRFQSVPVYATEDSNGRHRMLKYTPEHMHCLATIHGALAPPNTGVLAIQTSATNTQVTFPRDSPPPPLRSPLNTFFFFFFHIVFLYTTAIDCSGLKAVALVDGHVSLGLHQNHSCIHSASNAASVECLSQFIHCLDTLHASGSMGTYSPPCRSSQCCKETTI